MKHVMFPYRFLAFSVVMVCLLSCATDKVAAALKSAGDNRAELEKVLSYFESTGDREKVAAAKYIIGNMPGHISMWGEYESYWKDADRMLSASVLWVCWIHWKSLKGSTTDASSMTMT